MKWSVGAFVVALLILLGACGAGIGNSNNNSGVNGNWTADLSDPSGNLVFAFTTTFQQNSDNSITGSNLVFATPCFGQGATEIGEVGASGKSSGNVNVAFALNIQSGAPVAGGNNLSMQGALNNNTITGTWVLTGVTSGCTGSGSFTMTRM
jgi:hypothetical protein